MVPALYSIPVTTCNSVRQYLWAVLNPQPVPPPQLILENYELIEGSQAAIFQRFISHVESFRVLLKEWDDGNYAHIDPAVSWDADAWGDQFLGHIKDTYQNLCTEQERLMAGLMPGLMAWILICCSYVEFGLGLVFGRGVKKPQSQPFVARREFKELEDKLTAKVIGVNYLTIYAVSAALALTSCCLCVWQGLEVEAQTAVLAMKEAERSAAASKAKAALDELQVSGTVNIQVGGAISRYTGTPFLDA